MLHSARSTYSLLRVHALVRRQHVERPWHARASAVLLQQPLRRDGTAQGRRARARSHRIARHAATGREVRSWRAHSAHARGSHTAHSSVISCGFSARRFASLAALKARPRIAELSHSDASVHGPLCAQSAWRRRAVFAVLRLVHGRLPLSGALARAERSAGWLGAPLR